ncbi:MAG: hypothetical protein GYB65_01615 [Chloroflexi bacterium]|nr:hypothetical protein [Chloroflexota bacterium]
MGKILSTDIYWQGPGYYALKETKDGNDKRQEYHYLAPLEMRVEEVQHKAQALEKPPYYFTPRVRRWKERPAENGVMRIHDGAA